MLTIDTLQNIDAVALDVDRTIAGEDHRVSERTRAAIGDLIRLGLPVFLVTGRARANVLALARELGIRNAVASNNGSVEFDPVADVDLVVRTMEPDLAGDTIDLGQDLGLETTWWTTRDIYVDRMGACARTLEELGEVDIRLGERERLPAQITKTMYYGSSSALDAATPAIRAAFPGGFRSMETFYEFVAPGADKWAALSSMLARESISPQRCLGIGDGGNDVVWMTQIGLPIAMSNARDEVARVALATAGDYRSDGAAGPLEELAAAQRESRE